MTYLYLKLTELFFRLFYQSARMSRAQYGTGIFTSILIFVACMFLFTMLNSRLPGKMISPFIAYPLLLLFFALFVRIITLSIRRLHDIGYGAIGVILLAVPLFNLIPFLILLLKKGMSGENAFGDDPSCQELKMPDLKMN